MGDFSIRCEVSGLPIPNRTEVLAIKMGSSISNGSTYWYPVALPVTGVMGDYGEHEGAECLPDDVRWVYVLPRLWEEAAKIWNWAFWSSRNKPPSLRTTIENFRSSYRSDLRCSDANPEKELRFAMQQWGRDEWGRRLCRLLLFAPDDTPLNQLVAQWISEEEPPPEKDVGTLETMISAFMASCITGRDLLGRGEDFPFQQYPDLHIELKWHQAILREVKRIRAELKERRGE